MTVMRGIQYSLIEDYILYINAERIGIGIFFPTTGSQKVSCTCIHVYHSISEIE